LANGGFGVVVCPEDAETEISRRKEKGAKRNRKRFLIAPVLPKNQVNKLNLFRK